jgi:cytosine permease
MWIPTVVGVAMGSGNFGSEAAALAVPITGIAAFFMPGIISTLMSKDSVASEYFARAPLSVKALKVIEICPVEGSSQHRTDFVMCPYHGEKFISSTACASETRCGTMCHSPAYEKAAVAAPRTRMAA